jgi:hypothetical protein
MLIFFFFAFPFLLLLGRNLEMNFKQCVFLIRITKAKGYCLKFKTFLRKKVNPYPIRCEYFVQGKEGCFNKVEQKNYDISCIYLTRHLIESEKPRYYCALYAQKEPICKNCLFWKDYLDEYNYQY